jgi:ornithine decarboxylase
MESGHPYISPTGVLKYFSASIGLSIFFASLTIGITLQGLQQLVRSFRSDYGAFYVFASSRVHSNWNIWTKELSHIKPHYAVKCNPDRALLKTLSSLGSGFDCASGRELLEVMEVNKGNFKDNVVYANPCKPMRDLQMAKTLGSPTTVIDSLEEVDKLTSVKWGGTALLRILVEDESSLMPFSRKFGLPSEKASELASYANKKGISIKGVSFHVGSGCLDPNQYKKAIKKSHEVITKLNLAGHDADLVDIGGGFFSNKEQFETYAHKIRSSMYQYDKRKLKYIAEPGRFFAESAFDLFVQVIGKKPNLTNGGWRYTIDESLYGQFSCVPFDHKKPQWLRIPTSYENTDLPPRKRVKGTLYGRTCDSLDMIADSNDMEELEVGDWLWFPHMGAYSSVTASEFNGFPKPPLHGTDRSIYLPSVDQIQEEGYRSRFPSNVRTVTAVSVQSSDEFLCPAVA